MGTETSRSVTIREAGPADAAAIYEVGTECFTDAWREETVANDMEKPHSQYFVAEAAGKILGYACYWYVLDEAQLVNIGVRKEARRQGIAARLVEEGLAAAAGKGMQSMYLEVRVSNLPAQALYRTFGFSVKALRKGVYEMPHEDGYIMAKEIAASSEL